MCFSIYDYTDSIVGSIQDIAEALRHEEDEWLMAGKEGPDFRFERYAERLTTAAQQAYEAIDQAVCSCDSLGGTDIDHIRKIMDDKIGAYYE